MAGLRRQFGMRTSTMCLILESDMAVDVGEEFDGVGIGGSFFKEVGKASWLALSQTEFRDWRWECPSPPPSASIGMLYQQRVGAPPGLQASAFDKRKCGTCTMEPQRQM